MNTNEIKKIIRDSFNLKDEPSEYSQKAIEEWDSLGHLNLIMELEQALNIRFKSHDIPQLTSLKEIERAINEQ
ncbi:MAG: acyl carrier protein [Crenarchaeota archaeon]|nr:MAG: acyl carrier protein [Thermoproteota archaeon]